MADVLMTRLGQRADELTAAYAANDMAFAAYERAEVQWTEPQASPPAHRRSRQRQRWQRRQRGYEKA